MVKVFFSYLPTSKSYENCKNLATGTKPIHFQGVDRNLDIFTFVFHEINVFFVNLSFQLKATA